MLRLSRPFPTRWGKVEIENYVPAQRLFLFGGCLTVWYAKAEHNASLQLGILNIKSFIFHLIGRVGQARNSDKDKPNSFLLSDR